MASKKGKSKVITLKEVVKKYNDLLDATSRYVWAVRNPRMVSHSTSPVVVTGEGGVIKGRASVSIEELIATAKSGEILGYQTRIAPYDGGKALTVTFVQPPSATELPEAFRAEPIEL